MTNNKLFNYNFLVIISAYLVSKAGSIIYNIALAWWLINVTNSAKYVGFVLAASILPVAVLGPFMGVLSDKWNKKTILIFTDLVSGLVCVGMSILAYYNIANVYLVITGSFLLGCCSALFQPTVKSIIPLIIDEGNLVRANSLINGGAQTIKILSPLIASIVIATPFLGAPGAFALNGLSFIISALFEICLKYKVSIKTDKSSSTLTNLIDGFKYVMKTNIFKEILLVICLANIFISSFEVLIPLFVKNVINQSSDYYSYILTVYSLGGVAISIVLGIFGNIKNSKLIFVLALLLTSISLMSMSLFSKFYLMFVWVFLYGVGMASFETVFFSYMQAIIDKEYLGRVFSIIFLFAVIVTPISYSIFGFLGDYVLGTAFLYAGLGILISISILVLGEVKGWFQSKKNSFQD